MRCRTIDTAPVKTYQMCQMKANARTQWHSGIHVVRTQCKLKRETLVLCCVLDLRVLRRTSIFANGIYRNGLSESGARTQSMSHHAHIRYKNINVRAARNNLTTKHLHTHIARHIRLHTHMFITFALFAHKCFIIVSWRHEVCSMK